MNKKMCGLEDTAGDEQFTKCYKDLFANYQDKKDKAQVIAIEIEKCYIFDDVEVLLYSTILNNIIKKDWKSSDIRKRAVLGNSTRGLLPFAMVDLTEEDVAIMQQDHEYLLSASLVSTSEVKENYSKIIT